MSCKNFLILSTIVLLCYACSVSRYIPEDERLYTGATLEIESDSTLSDKSKDVIKTNLNSVLNPEPNSKILGMYLGLYFYYQNQKEHPGFINKWLNKNFGEEPIYQSDVKPLEVESLLLNRLDNRGFFYSSASSEFIEEEKKASAAYQVKVAQPYKMENYALDSLPQPIGANIKAHLNKTILKKGMRFDLPLMQLERKRIDQSLKLRGYYNFNERFLLFEADTNQYKNKRFDLYLKMKPETPKPAIVPYEISRINIYPHYNIETDSVNIPSETYNNKNYKQDELFFKLKYLDPFVTIQKGQLYNAETSKNTARRLSQIGTYKFVNIQYKEIDSALTDSLGRLEANIYLSPLNKRALQVELQGVTKSNNFTGPAISVSSINRNLFKGGESFKLSAKFGYEAQFTRGSEDADKLSSTQFGITGELTFPRIIFPIKVGPHFFKYNIPKSKTSLSLDYLNRKEYFSLISATALFGYTWDANKLVTYEVNPITVSYTKPWNITEEFQQILDDNPYMQDSFEQEFISGLTFSFTYNGLLETRKTDQIYFNTKLDIAGNSLSLISKNNADGSPSEIFGLEYAQYAKADIDIYYHHKFNDDHILASRIFGGYGIAYGNSTLLPNVKQYFSGGPYSVRAFRIRSLGPGTFDGSTVSDTYFDQTGNIRLEANIEYRFPIYSFLKGAAFVDAGNIWNSIENPALPGGKFTSSFMQELGMGVGLGARVDFQGFVIRLDLATPFHNPALPKGERYTFDTQESVLNFAIGYPF
ncbi:BamA/TamA family outer membrane protein [Tamlana sp. s12]|uniref:translocation and assembly module lipoprotein TamL n=1 Tax=Tamlana sp. s12 TaxID=1630406 RepID=UPI0007FDF80F|nr:BamA/TamA family outer membrane protein [Tamlana sp. s12]OBQ57244.1 outer membrane protein/protective antigen OMA87 [Tamlana sp. s12]QQY82566.1 BamA/TamA family outer membrane protein [Tamlana sp. s12]